MTNLIDEIARYLADNTTKMIEADTMLEKIHDLVLDKLEDDYNF
ncbi:TPA: hypothetical protein ACGO2Z_002336 [Streptococcus suis]